MDRLSSPIEEMNKTEYDVVVVGSGYGGAIMASRLARAGLKVCVLERGREQHPGEYPETPLRATKELQVNGPNGGHVGSHTGLFDLHLNPDISVLVGCGLGGTSLINANVSIRAETRVFDDPRWPAELRGENRKDLDAGYLRAEEMLAPRPYPADVSLPKLAALERSAAVMGKPFRRANINVTFEDGVNAAGVQQKACNNCGNCCSGCNYSAKNTVLMNYLPDAKRHGADIFVEVSVHHLKRAKDGQWNVHCRLLTPGRKSLAERKRVVTAKTVVLAAGTLGSTEILLRSKKRKLPISDQLGKGFSGNADMLGFGYNCTPEIDGLGFGQDDPKIPVGPCITGLIDMRQQPNLKDGILIEEGSLPGVLAKLLPPMFKLARPPKSGSVNTAPQNASAQAQRESASGHWSREGALMHTQTYLVMGHETDSGTMTLTRDKLRLDWPNVGGQPVFHKMNESLLQATMPLEGIAVKELIWDRKRSSKLVTVHPLGGCIMADQAESGVVNHLGQVFASTTGTAVHDGLYVCDGSIIPTSLGVNPLLTISALAERCASYFIRSRGLSID